MSRTGWNRRVPAGIRWFGSRSRSSTTLRRCATGITACWRLRREYRAVFLLSIVAFWIGVVLLALPVAGPGFLSLVDGGQFKLHVRAPDRNAH